MRQGRSEDEKKSIVALVAWGTSAARVGTADFAGATGAFLSTVMDRPCRRALPLFNVVVLHDVRCRKLLL